MARHIPVYLSPAELDRRAKEPHRNRVWAGFVIAVLEGLFVAAGGLPGIWQIVGAVGIGVGGFLIAGWIERWWRGFHTVPLEMLCEKVQALEVERNKLTREVHELKHPPPLEVHVNDFCAYMWDEEESKRYFADRAPSGRFFAFLSLEITNRSAQSMSIDCRARLLLKDKSRSIHRADYYDLHVTLLDEAHKENFHDDPIAISPHETVETQKAFCLWHWELTAIGGADNIGNDAKHVLNLTDRVTGRSCDTHFNVL